MNSYLKFFFMTMLIQISIFSFGQNVGISILTPAGKLHVKGTADVPQLIIDANSPQTNVNPLFKLRKSDGTDLLWLHSDDSTNCFLGLKAGRLNVIGPQGINNSFIGSRAGYSNTNGRDNTALGTNAFFSNTKGGQNIAIGTNALFTQSFAPGATWYQSNNVAVGFEALYSNQPTSSASGVNNTAVGTSAMHTNTTGAQNTAIGAYALLLNTNGTSNTAIGYTAMNSNTTATENTAVGKGALTLQSYDSEGAAWPSANVAVGFEALYSNQPVTINSGYQNTAIGHTALRANTTGTDNTGCGYDVLHANTTGFYNTANGAYALWNNINGIQNTGNGVQSLYATSSGNNNTALGYNSLSYNTTGSSNTAVGVGAYFSMFAGQNTTCLGYGSGGVVNADNRVEFGNSSNNWIGGQVSWSTFSDSRIKDDVREDVPGLNFINRLRPVTYHLNIHRENEMTHKDKVIGEWDSKYDIEKTKTTGFLAQDVEQAALAIGYDFSGVQKPENPDDLYSLRYSDFVVPLVKAVQEQQALIVNQQNRIENQQTQIENQQTQIDALLKRIEALERKIQ